MMIHPTQDDVQIALRTVLLQILPPGVDVIIGPQNRVPEPQPTAFVVMSFLRIQRLRTNIDTATDVRFIGSISGTEMTVTEISFGTILKDAALFGVGVDLQTKIIGQVSGPAGGVGVYTVSAAQDISSEVLASGAKTLEEGAEIVVQLDFHSEDNSASDMAQTVSTVLRDESGVDLFAAQGGGVVPLYADDPRYMPFLNENQQSEWRWVLEVHMQINQVVSLPQQYADQIVVGVISAGLPRSP